MELAELQFSVQMAAELSSENQAASHLEFCVSKVLNANANSDTEKNDNRSSKTFMRKALNERESPAKSADYIYENDNPARSKTAGQKLVVDVAMIGAKNGLASEVTADDGKAGI